MKYQYITTDPDVMTGKPVIVGTRVPISRVLFLLKEGYTLDSIQEEYPHVPFKNIKGAVDELIEKFDSSQYASEVL